MKRPIYSILAILGTILFLSFANDGLLDLNNLFNYQAQEIPEYITNDNTPNFDPITDEIATLGRVLFYDLNLSTNNTISCASCHIQEFAFSDTAQLSIGRNGGLTGRHSMRLVNARFGNERNFFWDERASSLEVQSTMPIQDHVEMGFSGSDGDPDFDDLINKLSAVDYYPELFEFAFGNATITEQRMQQALAQFMRSIQSFDSKYDIGLALVEDDSIPFPNFTAEENLGKFLFSTPPPIGAACARCHGGPEFDISRNSGNNGVIGVAGDPNAVDLNVTRSPNLRNLFNPSGALNGPLMHDGSFATLLDVINHYNVIVVDTVINPNLDPRFIRPNGTGQRLNLTETEKEALVAFLKTLTGNAVYTDERWSDPFDENGNLSLISFCDPLLVGTACDDGDECTVGEVFDSSCDCAGGVFADTDSDGVCDANDQCPGTDDALIGTTCDDGDACTSGETYDTNCNCSGGTPLTDSDGYGN